MIREIINRFNRTLAEKLVAPRRRHTAPMRVWFEPDTADARQREIARNMAMPGETVDMSRSGIGFLVPSIRVNEKYLVGQERILNVEIDLAAGRIELQVKGRRYEKVGIHLSVEKYLVGAEIIKLTPENEAAYDQFLRLGPRKKRGAAGNLELKPD